MPTKINVIITPTKVYTTYVQTICFEESFDENSRDEVVTRAKATAFNYAFGFGSCIMDEVTFENDLTSDEVDALWIKNIKH
jgi:hypothetical protein